MIMTDPIADMLTRIRNANKMRNTNVSMPVSTIKMEIAKILKENGFISNYQVVNNESVKKTLEINLKYFDKERVISGLRRISKPGLRVYAKADELPRVLNGLGIAIISTSQGLMTDKEARKLKIGGEVIAYVW